MARENADMLRAMRGAASMITAIAASVAAQPQWVRFDDGVQTSGGLTFSFSRPAEVYGADGRLLPIDAPRWSPPVLFCGPSETETLSVGLSITAYAAGLDADGFTPVYVIRNANQMKVSVHPGEGLVERAYRDGDWTGSYVKRFRDNSKGGVPNLLVGQVGSNGGTPDRPDLAFAPAGAGVVHGGLIVLNCDVLESVEGEFRSNRQALLYTTVDRLQHEDPWIVAALGESTLSADDGRGSAWSMAPFPLSPDELLVVWTDYRMFVKTGGVCYATRLSRAGARWNAESIRIAGNEVASGEHWHSGGYIHHPDGRESILVSTGDGVEFNRLMATTIAPGAPWSSGIPIPDTGVDVGSIIYERSANWTATAVVWGGTGTAPELRHNQAIGMRAASSDFSSLLCGADETSPSLYRLSYDPDLERPSWTTLYVPAVTSWSGDGTVNFALQGQPGGPYLSRIDSAGTGGWDANDRETRILYSPDGERWGQFAIAGTSTARQAVLENQTIYLGSSASESAGFRRISMPYWREWAPLTVGPSQSNLLRPLVPLPAEGVDEGATIARLTDPFDLPGGAPPPPCEPSNIFLVDNRSSTGRLGTWFLVSDNNDVPAPTSSVLVRAWAYALGPEHPGDPATTAQLTLHLRDAAGGRLDEWTDRCTFDAGAWMPVTMWVPADSFAPGGERADPWLPKIDLRAYPRHLADTRHRYLLAWEGFYQDSPTIEGNGLPPAQPGATEVAVVDGLSVGDEWTAFLVGMLPWDSWDNRVGGDGSYSWTRCPHTPQICALEASSGESLRILADPTREAITMHLDSGATASATSSIFWLRGSPVLCMVRARAGKIRLDYSVGGSQPRSLEISGGLSPDQITLGPDPMLWRSVEILPSALPDGAVFEMFSSLGLRCRADYDRNDLVNTADVLAYLNAWTRGDARADFNLDGRIDTTDFLAFLNAWAAGC